MISSSGTSASAKAPAKAPAPKPSVSADRTVAASPTPKPPKQPTYVVKSGDNLSAIAAAHDTTWQAIYKANSTTISNPSLIHTGDRLVIPASATAKAASSAETKSKPPADVARSGGSSASADAHHAASVTTPESRMRSRIPASELVDDKPVVKKPVVEPELHDSRPPVVKPVVKKPVVEPELHDSRPPVVKKPVVEPELHESRPPVVKPKSTTTKPSPPTKTETSAKLIDSYLKKKHSPLAGLGDVIAKAGEKYGVDPRLIVAISGAESTFGKHNFRPYNAWGWFGPKFTSWEHAINTIARGLGKNYVDRGLTSVDKIARVYCPPGGSNGTGADYEWPRTVRQFLTEMGGDPKNVRG